MSPKKTERKSASQKYKKLTDIDHVMLRPDTYLGAINRVPRSEEILSEDYKKIITKNIDTSHGMVRTFLEILSNAVDNVEETKLIKCDISKGISITIDHNEVTIINGGKPIPVEMHETEHEWIPTIIFGYLRSSGNFDDSEERTICGRNGYGSKLTNIFSVKYTVIAEDAVRHKKFEQTWTNNMKSPGKPNVTEFVGKKSKTTFKYTLDFKRFDSDTYTDKDIQVLAKHSLDASLTSGVPVKFKVIGHKNDIDTVFNIKTLEKYSEFM